MDEILKAMQLYLQQTFYKDFLPFQGIFFRMAKNLDEIFGHHDRHIIFTSTTPALQEVWWLYIYMTSTKIVRNARSLCTLLSTYLQFYIYIVTKWHLWSCRFQFGCRSVWFLVIVYIFGLKKRVYLIICRLALYMWWLKVWKVCT